MTCDVCKTNYCQIPGHVNYFELAKEITRPLSVGIGPDAAIVLLQSLKADVLEIFMRAPMHEVETQVMRAFARYEQKIQDAMR